MEEADRVVDTCQDIATNTRPGNRETDYGETSRGQATVPLEEVVFAQAFQLEALLNILERKGAINKADVLEEIKELQAKTPKAR
jgi:hypothetical protein